MGMGFYEKVLSYLSIGNVVKDLNTGKGRADLINFLTDGTLPEPEEHTVYEETSCSG